MDPLALFRDYISMRKPVAMRPGGLVVFDTLAFPA